MKTHPKITINRIFQNEHKTLSDNYLSFSQGKTIHVPVQYKGIELPWRENQVNISCIPAGVYPAVATNRASNGDYAILLDRVPGRTEIMIHAANFVRDLRGCQAPGTGFKDIDNDGIIDVENSRQVMRLLEKHLPVGTKLDVHVIDLWRIVGNRRPEI